MSTSFRAQPAIVEHIEKGEFHLVFPWVDSLPRNETENKIGHLALVVEELRRRKQEGVELSWQNWFDAHLEQAVERLLTLGDIATVSLAIDCFHQPNWRRHFAERVEECALQTQESIRGGGGEDALPP